MSRLLVTGARIWRSPSIVEAVLSYHRDAYPDAVLVHGAAIGLDLTAAGIWESWGLFCEPHEVTPLDYQTSGKQAPLLRNQHMVDLGALACLAFWSGPIPCGGTLDCVTRATEAGIPVYHHWESQPPPMNVWRHSGRVVDGTL